MIEFRPTPDRKCSIRLNAGCRLRNASCFVCTCRRPQLTSAYQDKLEPAVVTSRLQTRTCMRPVQPYLTHQSTNHRYTTPADIHPGRAAVFFKSQRASRHVVDQPQHTCSEKKNREQWVRIRKLRAHCLPTTWASLLRDMVKSPDPHRLLVHFGSRAHPRCVLAALRHEIAQILKPGILARP